MSCIDTAKISLSLCRASSLVTVLEGLNNDDFGDDRADAVIHALRRELDAADEECDVLSHAAIPPAVSSEPSPRKRKAVRS